MKVEDLKIGEILGTPGEHWKVFHESAAFIEDRDAIMRDVIETFHRRASLSRDTTIDTGPALSSVAVHTCVALLGYVVHNTANKGFEATLASTLATHVAAELGSIYPGTKFSKELFDVVTKLNEGSQRGVQAGNA